MQYRSDKTGTNVSILGYGCMRFPKKGGKIDIDAVTEQIGEAIKLGINYFDTAYVYGGSEAALGEALRRLNCRDKILIADKLPQYLIKSKAGMERCFQEQLSRLGTDHIDFYLMHMLTDLAAWQKLCGLGIREWIEEKKETGPSGASVFRSTAIQRLFWSCSMPMTGIFARFSIIIWMSTPRLAAKDWKPPQPRVSRLSLWNLCGEVG